MTHDLEGEGGGDDLVHEVEESEGGERDGDQHESGGDGPDQLNESSLETDIGQ